ncbi:MAG: hypothetical protein IPN46_17005 [Saprospiraceae bacterium]|nr:hypothetical protein [Saprospiraceae bacterium]
MENLDGPPILEALLMTTRLDSTDNDDNIYLTGSTLSNTGIATTGSFQPIRAGAGWFFLPNLTKLVVLQWASYLGGVGNDALYSIGMNRKQHLSRWRNE